MWLFKRNEVACDCLLAAFLKDDRIVLAFERAQLSLSEDAARMTLAILDELLEDDPPITGDVAED